MYIYIIYSFTWLIYLCLRKFIELNLHNNQEVFCYSLFLYLQNIVPLAFHFVTLHGCLVEEILKSPFQKENLLKKEVVYNRFSFFCNR